MKNKTGTFIAIFIVLFAMVVACYSMYQINRGAEEVPPDDCRGQNIVTYDEDGNVTSIENQYVKESDANSYSRPLMSVYQWVLVSAVFLIVIFGLVVCCSEECW